MSEQRPQQYVAEGTLPISERRQLLAFLQMGDNETHEQLFALYRESGLFAIDLQGRVVTYERPERGQRGATVWVKTVERMAHRVHVQTIYALGWRA